MTAYSAGTITYGGPDADGRVRLCWDTTELPPGARAIVIDDEGTETQVGPDGYVLVRGRSFATRIEMPT